MISTNFWITWVDISQYDSKKSAHENRIGDMVTDGMNLFHTEPIQRVVYHEKYVISETDKEKMYNTNKPQWSKSDESVRKGRASMMLDHFSEYVGKWKTEEYDYVWQFSYSKLFRHIPPMKKNISIDQTIQTDKNTEEKKKIGVTHVLVMSNE
jgi:hypothetical protein